MGNSESNTNPSSATSQTESDDYPEVFTTALLEKQRAAGKLYVAVSSVVFDVAQDSSFQVGGENHDLVGKHTVDDAKATELKAKFPVKGMFIEPHRFTVEELAMYDGKQSPYVFLCAKGEVFDVTPGRSFYGPDGGYKMMAGRDASRALALMSLDQKDVDNCSIEDLNEAQIKTLDDWVSKYHTKYTTVGWMGDNKPDSLQ